MLRRLLLAILPMVVIASSSITSRAATIAENLSANFLTGDIFGQSLTTQAGGPFNHITFNFFDNSAAPPGAPHAGGTAFILSHEYLGSPSGLSSSADLIASAAASGGFYQFAPSVTLQGNTQYFIYTDTIQNILFSVGDVYGGGVFYGAPSANFSSDASLDTAFRLIGTPAVPLPSALSLGAVSLPVHLLSLALHRRKLRTL
jgi:hypothetical protein